METLIENYLNGNISIARKQARRFQSTAIQAVMIDGFGFSETKARLTAHFLKTGEGWQKACDAK